MNKFSYKLYIKDKLYTIYIDSSKDDYKKIIINNKEVVNEKYTLALNRHAYIIYYPIDINGNKVVVSIDDKSINHSYNIYLNNVSIIDNTRLDEEYCSANRIVENGFLHFIKTNWCKILIENLFSILATVISASVVLCYTFREFSVKFLLAFIIVPLCMPAFMAGEWFHQKNILKKYRNCFRPTIQLQSGDGSLIDKED